MWLLKAVLTGDINKVKSKSLRIALSDKIRQIEIAKDISSVTGVKLLRGYTHHFRIAVKSEVESYRIGAIIRGEKIWLVRFLPRKTVYRQFP